LNGSAPDAYVVVSTDIEGLHHWPDAPVAEAYLRHPHRHLFTVWVRMQVHHRDREIEINELTRWLRSETLPALAVESDISDTQRAPDFGPQSCEQLAGRVAAACLSRHGDRSRWIECEVLEDGILGGGVRLTI
jgi:hypothetical protein